MGAEVRGFEFLRPEQHKLLIIKSDIEDSGNAPAFPTIFSNVVEIGDGAPSFPCSRPVRSLPSKEDLKGTPSVGSVDREGLSTDFIYVPIAELCGASITLWNCPRPAAKKSTTRPVPPLSNSSADLLNKPPARTLREQSLDDSTWHSYSQAFQVLLLISAGGT